MTLLDIQQVKTRIITAIVIMVTAVVGIFTFEILEQRRDTLTFAEHQTAGYAKALSQHAERSFAETERVSRDVLRDLKMSGGLNTLTSRQLYDMMKFQTEGSPQIGDMFMVDAHGVMFTNTNSYPPRQIDVSDRDYFKFYASTPSAGVTLGAPVKSRLVNRWRFNLMRPLAQPGQPFQGLLAVAFEVEYFKKFFDPATIGRDGKIMLIHRNGKPLVHEPYVENAYSADFTQSKLFKEMLPKNLDSGTFHIDKGIINTTPRIASYQNLSRYPVIALVSLNRDEVLAPWRDGALFQGAVTAVFCLVIAGLGKITFMYINRLYCSQNELQEQKNALAIKALQVDIAQDAILLLDLDGRIVECNIALAEMTGYTVDTLKGKNLAEIEPQGYAENITANIASLFQTGNATFESAYLTKDGVILPTEVHAKICQIEGTTRIISIVRDIRERKNLEKREATKFRILEKMSLNSPLQELLTMIVLFVEEQKKGALCSVLLADTTNNVLRHGAAPSLPDDYNRAVDGLRIANKMGSCGTAAFLKQRVVVEDITTHPYWKGFAPANNAGLRSCWSEPIISGDGELLGTFAIYHREPGTPTPDEIALIESAANLANLAISRFRSREQHLQLEEQLRHIQKIDAVGQLAGGIAHDLNNLLTPILVYGEMIKKKLPAADPQYRKIEGILLAAHKARDLNQKLLSFSRKQMLCMETIELNSMIRDFRDIFHRTIPENIELSISTEEQHCYIHGDKGQIEQALLNLVVNAKDAISGNGAIRIHTATVLIEAETARRNPGMTAGKQVLLTVSDTGCGMSEAVLQRIFEPFYTTKETGKGTGLGLAMVYGIVKQHNGYIGVESKKGEGSVFMLYFPAAEEPATHADPGKPDHAIDENGHPSATVTILLAEDNEMIRNMTTEILQLGGYEVFEAELPSKALAIAKAHPEIRLLISDVVMPEMNGRELHEHLRYFLPGLPAIFMSGYTNNVILHEGTPKEGYNFLHKPFTSKQMLDAVRAVLAG